MPTPCPSPTRDPADLGVAIWGQEFDPGKHEQIVRRAREENFYPSVDIFLPVCNEPTEVLDNTWRHVAAIEHPGLNVYVLDDGAKEEVRTLARIYGFRCEGRAGPSVVFPPPSCGTMGRAWLQAPEPGVSKRLPDRRTPRDVLVRLESLATRPRRIVAVIFRGWSRPAPIEAAHPYEGFIEG